MTETKVNAARKLLADGMSPRDVAQNLGVSIPTLYRWLPAAESQDTVLRIASEMNRQSIK